MASSDSLYTFSSDVQDTANWDEYLNVGWDQLMSELTNGDIATTQFDMGAAVSVELNSSASAPGPVPFGVASDDTQSTDPPVSILVPASEPPSPNRAPPSTPALSECVSETCDEASPPPPAHLRQRSAQSSVLPSSSAPPPPPPAPAGFQFPALSPPTTPRPPPAPKPIRIFVHDDSKAPDVIPISSSPPRLSTASPKPRPAKKKAYMIGKRQRSKRGGRSSSSLSKSGAAASKEKEKTKQVAAKGMVWVNAGAEEFEGKDHVELRKAQAAEAKAARKLKSQK